MIGGILADFDQKIFRTLPPTQELVHHARPDAPVPASDGGGLPRPPRSSGELAGAVEATWAVIEGCLERWTLDSLDVTAERRNGDRVQVHSRASVLNRIFTHETYHIGEMSQVLGLHGFEAIDPWAKPWLPG